MVHERFQRVQGHVSDNQGSDVGSEQCGAGLVYGGLAGGSVEGLLGRFRVGRGVLEQLELDGFWRWRERGSTPVPAHAAEVAEEVEGPVEAFDEGGEGVGLPGKCAVALGGAEVGVGYGVAVDRGGLVYAVAGGGAVLEGWRR